MKNVATDKFSKNVLKSPVLYGCVILGVYLTSLCEKLLYSTFPLVLQALKACFVDV